MTQIVAARSDEPVRDIRVILRIRDSDRGGIRGPKMDVRRAYVWIPRHPRAGADLYTHLDFRRCGAADSSRFPGLSFAR